MNHNGLIKNNINKFATFYRIADLIFIKLGLVLSVFIYQATYTQDYFVLYLISSIGFSISAEMLALYRSWRDSSFKEIIFYTFISWVLSCVLILIYLFLSQTSNEFSRAAILCWFIATTILLIAWRACFALFLRHIRRKGLNTRSVAIIGLTKEGESLANEILANPQTGFRLTAIYDDRELNRLPEKYQGLVEGNINDGVFNARVNSFDVVYIALPLIAEERIKSILQLLGDTTVNVQLVPNLFMFSIMSASMAQVNNIQTISVFCNPMRGSYALVKRIEDILLSVFILLLIAFPMLVIAIAIKTTSKGPVIFKQNRYGLNGKHINVYKFRSMTVTENSDVVTQATKGDARITKVGGFLRRTSLDELPQFINVLQGTMSVVGPRPHAASHNEEYRKAVDYYMLRHKIRPGITGWAQINGWRGETDTLEKMEMRIKYDLEYIRQWSLWMDAKIVFYTIFRSFNDKNAY